MSSFLVLLTAYYICSAEAERRPLPVTEALPCIAAYEAVKARFAASEAPPPATPERVGWNTANYLAFQDWEARNPGLVAGLKAQARDEIAMNDIN